MRRKNNGGASGSKGVFSTWMIVKFLPLEFLSFDSIKKQIPTGDKTCCVQIFYIYY